MALLCAAFGNTFAADDRFCRVCGRVVGPVSPVAIANVPLTPAAPAQTSGKATASLVCGLLFFIPLAFVAAIVFGHLALSEIRKSAGRLKVEGLAIAGLVLGYAWIVSIPVILIIGWQRTNHRLWRGFGRSTSPRLPTPTNIRMRVTSARFQTSPVPSMANWRAVRRTDMSSDCPAARRPRAERSSSIKWSLLP
jgi:hypothetical protein